MTDFLLLLAAVKCSTHIINVNNYGLRLKNTMIDKTLTYASETWTPTNRDRKQPNVFERKVYRRILGPVYDNEKENWRILTNKDIYASVKKT
jgi:hypothetical protein